MQRGVAVIPKSVKKERMKENFNVFDSSLPEDEMHQIEVMDTVQSPFFSHYDPHTVEWFMSLV